MTTTTSSTSSSPLPPSRISHRAEGGPDLNYLYATNDDNDDGATDENEDDGNNKNQPCSKKQQQQQLHPHRVQRRGLRADTRALRGTSLYLGGEEGPNQKIYCIPGHASRVLCINTITDEVHPIGPVFDAKNMISNGKFKWLRGIVVGDIIFGLPCHADCVLKINTNTDEVTTIPIPYEEYFDDKIPMAIISPSDLPTSSPTLTSTSCSATKATTTTTTTNTTTLAYQERHQPWKFHGGAISPHDGCIYAIPQTSRRVLRIDPITEQCSFVGPELQGRCKWYGGVVGKTDGAIYGSKLFLIPTPTSCALHKSVISRNCVFTLVKSQLNCRLSSRQTRYQFPTMQVECLGSMLAGLSIVLMKHCHLHRPSRASSLLCTGRIHPESTIGMVPVPLPMERSYVCRTILTLSYALCRH